MKLNLGCSDALLPGYVNVDISPPADVIADLNERWLWRWLWADSSVDEIRASHIIEHLRSPVHTMNEAWRVLRPGGRFIIDVPTTDGRGAWQDPGHVSFWNRNSFFYYEAGNVHLTRFAPANGVRCAFRVVAEHEEMYANQVSILHIELEAVKCTESQPSPVSGAPKEISGATAGGGAVRDFADAVGSQE
jgi:SAM-dependent methyltransferase